MRLSRVDNDRDSYAVFNERDFFIEDSFEPILNKSDKISLNDFKKCALDVVKKNQSNDGKIRRLVELKSEEPYIVIKESSAQLILNKIEKDCPKQVLSRKWGSV